MQGDCNRTLASQLPAWLRDHPKEVAIDLHDAPYYGKDDLDDKDCWVCRGEAREGTTRFYCCATAYIMHKDVRFTLAVVFMHPKNDLAKIVKQFIRRVKALKIKVKRCYFDKGFCSIAVLRILLADPNLSAIVAVPIRGKKGGTRALCRGRGSYRLLEQVRGRTTARNPTLRFLWMGLALLIGNIWIALHWKYLLQRHRGRYRILRKHFILDRMAQFLRRAVENIYGVIDSVEPISP